VNRAGWTPMPRRTTSRCGLTHFSAPCGMAVSEIGPLPSARFLTRQQAAAYLGVSARTFDAEVTAGIWPAPMRRGARTGALTWDCRLLDRAADRLAGLVDSEIRDRALDDAEARALEASRGPAPNRHQHRHPKAG
jgi:hypothetical protein